MTKPGQAARSAALDLLTDVTERGKLLSEVVDTRLEGLSPDDRARTQRLAVTTLRFSGKADRVLGPFLKLKPYEKLLNILRLGVVEVQEAGAPPHAAVDGAVALAKAHFPETRQPALVNAVLRKAVKTDGETWRGLPAQKLPKWLRSKLVAAYGGKTVSAMEAAHERGAPLDITAKQNPEAWAEELGGQALATGSIRLPQAGQVSAMPGFATGDWWVQDAAAALPVRLMAPMPGERVLDLCAAPGGKTMQIAATGAEVTALDQSESRMARVSENLARTGLTARIEVADALTWEPGQQFDAVLLDAPCSATGTIRRHPDLPSAKDWATVEPLFALQAQLLQRALDWVKPGGRMVFCTCSLLPHEGEDQVAALLDKYPGVSVVDVSGHAGIDPDWFGEVGLRLRPDFWPETGGLDGFFISVLHKAA